MVGDGSRLGRKLEREWKRKRKGKNEDRVEIFSDNTGEVG
jgi:hypothetical protein